MACCLIWQTIKLANMVMARWLLLNKLSATGHPYLLTHLSPCDLLQGHLGPIMGLVIAITAPMLSDSKAKVSTGPVLPTPLYLLFTTAALASARLVLFDVLLLFLGYPPSAGLLAGASLVALALAQIPLLQQRYPHSQSPRRAVAAVTALGVLLALLRPPLPETVRIL